MPASASDSAMRAFCHTVSARVRVTVAFLVSTCSSPRRAPTSRRSALSGSMARRFLELGLARASSLAASTPAMRTRRRRHFGRQLADGERQRVFLRFQRRQRLLDRFQALGLAGRAEAVARGFDEQRAAAAAFAVVGVRRDPLVAVALEAGVDRFDALDAFELVDQPARRLRAENAPPTAGCRP
jgi:hypothetical protein